ncbi:MAG: hypothetical protein ABSB35_23070, partial [Bryobacteraceae bacterium]
MLLKRERSAVWNAESFQTITDEEVDQVNDAITRTLTAITNAPPFLEYALYGSPQEFVTSGILRGFPGFLKSDVFGVGHGYAPCFQQEVT